MDELEMLVAKKDFAEALLRLPHVPSSDRGSKWEGLVEKAALAYVADLTEESPSNAMLVVDEMHKTFPHLTRSLVFEKEKNRVAFKGFDACYRGDPADAPECQKRFLEFVKKGRNVPELAFEAGKLVAAASTAANAYPFFKLSLGPLTREKFCLEPLLRKTLAEMAKTPDSKLATEASGLFSRCRLK